ncbi:MAG: hypothetical protein RLZZ338_3997 [Cyanobacteriota bacterium]
MGKKSKFARGFAKLSPSDQRLLLYDPKLKIATGQIEKYYDILTNFDFIFAKINHPSFGLQALVDDYKLLNDPRVATLANRDQESERALRLIQKALEMSGNILNEDKTQLAGQLLGRLLSLTDLPKIQQLLAKAKEYRETPWLCPLTPSLTSAESDLIRTVTGHSDPVKAVALTPDGTRVVSTSFDNTLKVWDLATGEFLHTLTGHSGKVYSVALTPDGTRVVSASYYDNTLKVWDLMTGTLLDTLTGHSGAVNAVALTPDGTRVVSASSDNTLKVWDLMTGKEEMTFGGDAEFTCCAVSPDGRTIVAGDQSGMVHFFRMEGLPKTRVADLADRAL